MLFIENPVLVILPTLIVNDADAPTRLILVVTVLHTFGKAVLKVRDIVALVPKNAAIPNLIIKPLPNVYDD